MEKLKLIADTVLEYVTEWGRARCEQNSLHCDMEIEKLKGILNNWRVREKNKERVHAELTKFLTQDTAVSTGFFLFNYYFDLRTFREPCFSLVCAIIGTQRKRRRT